MTRFAKCLLILTFVVCSMFVCSVCCGWFDNVKTDYLTYKVQGGDTLNGIAAKYHGLNTKGYIDLDNYAMMIRVTNNDKHNMNRVLQVGDEVKIPVYSVVAFKLW